jgi:hypothetical protein
MWWNYTNSPCRATRFIMWMWYPWESKVYSCNLKRIVLLVQITMTKKYVSIFVYISYGSVILAKVRSKVYNTFWTFSVTFAIENRKWKKLNIWRLCMLGNAWIFFFTFCFQSSSLSITFQCQNNTSFTSHDPTQVCQCTVKSRVLYSRCMFASPTVNILLNDIL